MQKVVFVTYDQRPDLSASDQLVADALRPLGVEVVAIPWGRPAATYAGSRAIILRSNWDYPKDPEAFSGWLDSIAHLPVFNSATTVQQNLYKTYLAELKQAGIKVPRTALLAPSSDVGKLMAELGLTEAVVKPVCGASGAMVQRIDLNTAATWRQEISPVFANRDFLLQELVTEIAQGEISMAFFAGQFSHAVLKIPAAGEFRINSQYQGHIQPYSPSEDLIKQGADVLSTLPEPPLYARVDGVLRNNDFLLFELELNEPSFFFTVVPEAATNFARAIADQLG
ncbi:MAG: hypothetical protein AAF529_00060 [Pseudomonadota bacterium]